MMRRSAWLACVTLLFAAIGMAGNWIPPPLDANANLMQRLAGAHWIGGGAKSSDRMVYVFTDPNCPYCNDLWTALQREPSRDVQIRYLLVAVIDADSHAKDAAILESADPMQALGDHERRFAQGGISPKPKSRSETNEILSANEGLMSKLHIYATPGLVYLDARKEMKVFVGMPSQKQLHMILGEAGS